MSKKAALFKLIHSLTKTEKRYFKRFASLHGAKSNYLPLFEAIEKQTDYDEAAIKGQFEGQNFIRQLHVTKNYLYKLILKSLRNFHQKRTIPSQLKAILLEAEILFDKELYDAAAQILDQGEAMASKYEKYPALLEIWSWKRRLLLARFGPGTVGAEVNEILVHEKEVLGRLDQLNGYWSLTMNLMRFFPPESNHPLKENPLLQTPPTADRYQATILYHHIWYTLNTVSSNTEQAGQHLDTLIKFLEKHPWQIQADPSSYMTTLNNKIGLLLNQKAYHQIPELLEKTHSITERYNLQDRKHITIKLQLRSYNVELEMYRDTEQFTQGVTLSIEAKKFLLEHQNNIPAEYWILLHYQFAYLHFMTQQYREALRDTNEILNFNSVDVRADIFSFARFLNLTVHYELNNIIVLRYAVASTRRYLKKKRNLLPFEKILLRFFSKISTTPKSHQKDLFLKLDQELIQCHPPILTASDLDYLDFKRWIKSKIS